MVATLLVWGVVNQVSIMSAYSITYRTSPAHLPVWVLTCPPCHSEDMIAYLRRNQCKFHMVMSRVKWERKHSFDFDTFYIESAPQIVIDRLVQSTQSKGGQINLGNCRLTSPNANGLEVDLSVCPLTQDQLLSIKINGAEIPASGDDMDDYEWWLAQDNLDLKLKTFIEMAVNGRERDIVFHYDTRINLNLRELLESCGFSYIAGEESMRYFNT